MRRLLNLLSLILFLGAVWFFRAPILSAWGVLESRFLPCARPIPYALNNFDERFGMSREEFLSAIKDAEEAWETAAGKELFEFEPEWGAGDLAINLIYDERQASTDRLKSLGLTIDDSKKTYDALNSEYAALQAEYDRSKAALESFVAAYKNAKAQYDSKVSYWNSRGGAATNAFKDMEVQRLKLNQLAESIKTGENSLNSLAEDINAIIVVLNRIAMELNLTARNYNRIGNEEFEEGLYKADALGREIDIYQYDDRTKLVRVLAHELGHALGLEHVEDSEAVMYRLNQGRNEKLTAADIAALKSRCGLE